MGRLLLGCIADDLTGATDLANNLVRKGMRTVQTVGVPSGPIDGEPDAVVIALKSRTIPAAEAVAQSLAALARLVDDGVEQVYFKYCSTFDSTDEGNIGPVADALLDALHGAGRGFTITCPAFPENRRTVFNGHLFVGDRLLGESGMQNHPLTPMRDADLVRVLQRQTRRRVGLIAYDVVARGPDAIRERCAALEADGVGIAIVDAISNDDLMRIGAAVRGMRLVTAGSGVAIGLPQNWQSRLAAHGASDALPPGRGLQAIVSGSCSTATNAQVAAFRDRGGAAIAIDPLAIAAGDDAVADALRSAVSRLGDGPVLVYATAPPEAVAATQAALGVQRAGALVEQALGRIAVGLVDAGVRQLVVAGGETSGAVIDALGVRQLAIGPQIAPGVPWTAGRRSGGDLLHLALKSGNFGSPAFFTEAFAALATRR